MVWISNVVEKEWASRVLAAIFCSGAALAVTGGWIEFK